MVVMNEIDVPKVSVVVPVYNANDVLLDRALGSVFSQTEQSFEIILVDDGSQNGCVERIASIYKRDCRLRIIRQNNSGIQGALDTGIKYARGEYFYVIAQDDFAHPQTFEYCCGVIERENADLCIFYGYSQHDFESPKCKLFEDINLIPCMTYSYVKTPPEEYVSGLKLLNMDAWGHFARMSLVRKVHAVWPLYDGVARTHYMLTMADRWIRSSAKLYYYNTINPASVSKKAVTSVFIERWRCEFKALYDIYAGSSNSEAIWRAIRRFYVIKGVKMVVNQFRRCNKACSKELNIECFCSMVRMLRDFFDCGMLPMCEVNFRMYLYYRWIVLRYGYSQAAAVQSKASTDIFLSDFGYVLSDGIKKE